MKNTNYLMTLFVAILLAIAPAAVFAQDGEPDADQGDVRITKAPKMVERVQAEYTQDAIDNRVEGVVKLQITLDAEGVVTKVEVLESLGFGLDEAAVAAIKASKFEPAEINNIPAAVVLPFSVSFSLPILPGSFEGKVVDSETGQGVPATITITYAGEEYDPKPTATLQTEVTGEFAFADVPPGPYEVTLQLEGYDDFKSQIEVFNGQASESTFKVSASPVNVEGQLREAGTRSPLAAAGVKLLDPKTGQPIRDGFTDAEGMFSFRGVPAGKFTLRLEAEGFFTSTAEVEVVKGERTSATFYIEKEFYDEYSINTTAKRAKTEVNRQRLEIDEIRRIPGTNGDVVRVVQNLPGVARAPFVSGLIIVRGSAPQDTKVFLEGDNIPIVYHFFGGPAVINSEMIDAIDFYAGNFSSRYGRATAGIIDISTRSPKTDRFHGMIDVDLLDTTAMIEGPITDDLSFAISGRRSYIDVFLPLVLPDDGPDLFVAPRYYDYQFWLTYKGFEDHTLELFIYGSDDRIELILPDGEPQGNSEVQVTGLDLSNSFLRGQLRWEWRPDLPIENTLMMSYGINSAFFQAADNFYFDIDFTSSQIRNDLAFTLSEHVKLKMGIDLLYGYNDYSIETPRFEDDGSSASESDGNGGRPNFSRDGITANDSLPALQPAVYTELELRPVQDLLLIPGLRVDHFGEIGATSVSPRFAFRWGFLDRWTAKGGVGLFTQPTAPGTSDPNFGNPNLTFEKALQYSLGGEYQPLDFLTIDVTGFYRDLFDILSNSENFTVDSDGNTRPVVFENEGEGRAYGMELLIRHLPQNRFFGWLAYTLSKSERKSLDTGEYVPFQYDQRHIFTLVAGYNLPYGFDISARFRLVTGSPTTPVEGSVLNTDTDEYEQVFGETNSARNATFHQLDLRVDKKFIFDAWILGFYLDVQNVYNATNQEGVRYNYDFSESEPVMGLPFLPTLGVSAQF